MKLLKADQYHGYWYNSFEPLRSVNIFMVSYWNATLEKWQTDTKHPSRYDTNTQQDPTSQIEDIKPNK